MKIQLGLGKFFTPPTSIEEMRLDIENWRMQLPTPIISQQDVPRCLAAFLNIMGKGAAYALRSYLQTQMVTMDALIVAAQYYKSAFEYMIYLPEKLIYEGIKTANDSVVASVNSLIDSMRKQVIRTGSKTGLEVFDNAAWNSLLQCSAVEGGVNLLYNASAQLERTFRTYQFKYYMIQEKYNYLSLLVEWATVRRDFLERWVNAITVVFP